MSTYTPHDHTEYVEGCFRCDLSRQEARDARLRQLADAKRAKMREQGVHWVGAS